MSSTTSPPVGDKPATKGFSPTDEAAIESVVRLASRAPSLHNTQPWLWRLHDDVLDVRADRARQLAVADPDGHSLLLSCGAAIQLTEIALAAHGWAVKTSLLPEDADADLLARVRLGDRGDPDQSALQQAMAAGQRRSERRVFGPQAVPAEEMERLRTAAAAPAVYAHFPVREDESLELAVAISRADRSEQDDPAYAAELAEWVRRDPATADGVPTSVIPAVREDQPRHTDIPLRDFERGIPGTQLISAGVDERPLIAVILTGSDTPTERLRAGQSMMRLMIQAEQDGLASCALSQSVDLLFFRSQLRAVMSWTGHPQMMLRIGRKPAEEPAPLTARRPVAEVLTMTPQHSPERPAPVGRR